MIFISGAICICITCVQDQITMKQKQNCFGSLAISAPLPALLGLRDTVLAQGWYWVDAGLMGIGSGWTRMVLQLLVVREGSVSSAGTISHVPCCGALPWMPTTESNQPN